MAILHAVSVVTSCYSKCPIGDLPKQCKNLLRGMAVATLVAALLSNSPTYAATPFFHETVATGSVGLNNSLVLDAQGNPHISYSEDQLALLYTTKKGGAWITEIVESAAWVGSNISLVLDTQGNPHITYNDINVTGLKYARRVGSTWTVETVDTGVSVGEHNSIALDAQGNPHISYWHKPTTSLKYAARLAGVWSIDLVDGGSSDVGEYNSLAIDGSGIPHISYFDETNGNLLYMKKIGGFWTSPRIVDGTGFVGWYTSIALDAKEFPHICYHHPNDGSLKYASLASGTWSIEVVDATGFETGTYNSLALDALGNPRISYKFTGVSELKYAAKVGGIWSLEIVDGVGNVDRWSSLALDAQGNPHISYYDGQEKSLRYTSSAIHLLSPTGGERWAASTQQIVRWSGVGTISIEISGDGGLTYSSLVSSVTSNEVAVSVPNLRTEEARVRIRRDDPVSTSISPRFFSIAPGLVNPWWSATADGGGGDDVGAFPSLALDSHGNPRISHYDQTNFALKYTRRSGGLWISQTVDTGGDVGIYSSLALDHNGEAHICYHDDFSGDLKFAFESAGSWLFELVDTGGDVGEYASLALDSQGEPHVSYYDASMDDLKYASRAGGSWTIETVKSSGNVGLYTSLALDDQDNPRISYYYSSNGDLEYAEKNAGTWTIEVVDSDGLVGFHTSLALDVGGDPRISYWDLTDNDLNYASRDDGAWSVETVDAEGSVGQYTSLELDSDGNPHISYYDETNGNLKYAVKRSGLWNQETVVDGGIFPLLTSLALDAQNNARVSYYASLHASLGYVSSAIEVAEPSPGVTWPVGSRRAVTWDGTGLVDLYLSVDGGNTWELRESALSDGEYRLTVPHTPTRFAKVRLERAVPRSSAENDSLFTIETDVVLLNLSAEILGTDGVRLSWQTEPGPEDLAGYKLQRALGQSDWVTIVGITTETTYLDPQGAAGSRYRLFALNGLGDELLLGETSIAPAAPLAAWPLPYRGGVLNISFATSTLGGVSAETEVILFDLAGRRIQTIARGKFSGAFETVRWDGTDQSGRRIAPGVYFLKTRSGKEEVSLKVVVLQQ